MHSSESAPASRRSSLASSTFSPVAEHNSTFSSAVSSYIPNTDQTLLTRCPIQ